MDWTPLNTALHRFVDQHGGMREAAAALGLSYNRVNQMCCHPSTISKKVAEALGYRIERKITYTIVRLNGGRKS